MTLSLPASGHLKDPPGGKEATPDHSKGVNPGEIVLILEPSLVILTLSRNAVPESYAGRRHLLPPGFSLDSPAPTLGPSTMSAPSLGHTTSYWRKKKSFKSF